MQGGPKNSNPKLITKKLIDEFKKFKSFDPDHLPAKILLIEALIIIFPKIPQIACFDTTFHKDLTPIAKLLPIPRRYAAKGVQKYGFHGLSYQSIMYEFLRIAGKKAANGRIIIAHLGNGSSLSAVRKGKSIDTSMSFTQNSGVCMNTRSGDLDPGLFWYLICHEHLNPKKINHMLNFESGLLGLSETSFDMRDLQN